MPLVPWHRLVICSHLLLLCGGLLLAFSWSCPPPGPLFLLVLGRAFLALCLFLVFSLVPLLLWLLCVVFFCWCFCLRFCGCLLFGLCVPPLVLWGFLVCCFCCAVGGSPPPLTVVSLPPSVVPLRRPGPVTVLVPPSGYLVASCDGPVALMLGVLWCFVSSLHLASWQQRHLALCGVLCYPLHHGACVVVVLCTPALRYSSLDDPGLPLDTAKLTRHSLQHVWHTLLLSSSAFPAPSLPPPPCLVVCVCSLGFGVFLSLCAISSTFT